MSTSLFDLFKFSKLLDMSDGKLTLMNVPVNVIPTSIFCNQQKMLIKTLGFENAYGEIYSESKEGSYEYNLEFIKKEGFDDVHRIIDWQTKIVAFAGWGKLELAVLDSETNRVVVHFKNSPYPKAYGNALYPVDFVAAGFVAGGVSALFKKDIDALETKCEARGDPFCEIETGSPLAINKKKADLWKRWKLISKR